MSLLLKSIERGEVQETKRIAHEILRSPGSFNQTGSDVVDSFLALCKQGNESAPLFVLNCLKTFKTNHSDSLSSDEVEDSLMNPSTLPILALLTIGLKWVSKKTSPGVSQRVLDALRSEYAWIRRDARHDVNLQPAVFTVLLEIIKICIREKNPLSVDPLLQTAIPIESAQKVPKSIIVPLLFFWARHSLFMDRIDEAILKFESALQICGNKPQFTNKRNVILRYLVPIKILSGYLPGPLIRGSVDKEWLRLISALTQGHVSKVREIGENMILSIKFQEVGLLFGFFEIIAVRNLLAIALKQIGSPKMVSISFIASVFGFAYGQPMSEGQALDIIAQLIVSELLNVRICNFFIYIF